MEHEYLKYVGSIDASGLEQLMNTYGEDVWNYAFFLTKNLHLADDITQDVFLRAYRGVASFRGECSVKSWLLKITHNTTINYRRSAFVRKVTLIDYIHSEGRQGSAESEFMDRMVSDEIWHLVLKLPVKLREVLMLHMQYDMTLEEMSEIIGVPIGTVKSRLFRARAKVSHELKEARVHEQI